MIYDLFRMMLGLLIICFHRQIADFILHQEEAIAGLLRRRGVRLPGFPSPEFAHDLYFVIGAAVTLVSVLKIVFAGQI
jgi:hypothetical protein